MSLGSKAKPPPSIRHGREVAHALFKQVIILRSGAAPCCIEIQRPRSTPSSASLESTLMRLDITLLLACHIIFTPDREDIIPASTRDNISIHRHQQTPVDHQRINVDLLNGRVGRPQITQIHQKPGRGPFIQGAHAPEALQ